MTDVSIQELLQLVEHLRAPDGGCAWDKKQTHHSLMPYLIEESYEVIDAIEKDDINNLKEELGDVLFQLILHSQLAKERNDFQFNDVVSHVLQKMLRRHPHVFPEGTLVSFGMLSNLTPKEIEQQWQKIKAQEKQEAQTETAKNSILDDVSASQPPMQTAVKLQKKAATVGFDWSEIGSVFAKIREELAELEEAVKEQEPSHIQEELGDLLFGMANLARHLKMDPEQAMRGTNQKFRRRFARIEQILDEKKRAFTDCDLAELDKYWDQAKAENL